MENKKEAEKHMEKVNEFFEKNRRPRKPHEYEIAKKHEVAKKMGGRTCGHCGKNLGPHDDLIKAPHYLKK